MMGTRVRRSTFISVDAKGTPLSRAKAQVIREAEVVMPVAQAQVRMRMMAPITVAQGMLLILSTWCQDFFFFFFWGMDYRETPG